MILALVVFVFYLDWTLTLVIFVVMCAYGAFWMFCSYLEFVLKPNLGVASVLLTRWRIWLRRAMNERDTVCQHIHSSRKHNPNHSLRSRVASTQTVY